MLATVDGERESSINYTLMTCKFDLTRDSLKSFNFAKDLLCFGVFMSANSFIDMRRDN
jgi:hypothetical protein